MQYFENVPPEFLIGATAAVVLLLVWIWAIYGRRRQVATRRPDATEPIVRELGRIADALERLERMPEQKQALSVVPESPLAQEPPAAPGAPTVEETPATEEVPARRITLSMFGRQG
jgi:hypothetical protein